MTNTTRRCRWCGERFALTGGPGRPPEYCRRSHRQRAYEARAVAEARGLTEDEVLLGRDAWMGIRDAVYIVEAAARDAEMDLTDASGPEEVRAIVLRLVDAVAVLTSTPMEPRAVGSEE